MSTETETKPETNAIPTEVRGTELPALKAPWFDGVFGGVITMPDGKHVAVVFLDKAKPPKRQGADAQRKWAKRIGAQLITRAIGSLLVSTLGDLLPQELVWTEEDYAHDAAFAWHCDLYDGYVSYSYRSAAGGAVAVRLIPLVL